MAPPLSPPTAAPIAAPFQAPSPPPRMPPMAAPVAAPAPVPYTAPLVVRLRSCHQAHPGASESAITSATACRFLIDPPPDPSALLGRSPATNTRGRAWTRRPQRAPPLG